MAEATNELVDRSNLSFGSFLTTLFVLVYCFKDSSVVFELLLIRVSTDIELLYFNSRLFDLLIGEYSTTYTISSFYSLNNLFLLDATIFSTILFAIVSMSISESIFIAISRAVFVGLFRP